MEKGFPFSEYWGQVKLILRLNEDNTEIACGSYSGGPYQGEISIAKGSVQKNICSYFVSLRQISKLTPPLDAQKQWNLSHKE